MQVLLKLCIAGVSDYGALVGEYTQNWFMKRQDPWHGKRWALKGREFALMVMITVSREHEQVKHNNEQRNMDRSTAS